MQSPIRNPDVDEARAQLRGALRRTRWLRRIAVLLGLVIAGLLLAFRFQA